MLSHRLTGTALSIVGLVILFGQLAMLYGTAADRDLMVAIGLPGVCILSSVGAIAFAMGCLLAAVPNSTVKHVGRGLNAVRRGKRA